MVVTDIMSESFSKMASKFYKIISSSVISHFVFAARTGQTSRMLLFSIRSPEKFRTITRRWGVVSYSDLNVPSAKFKFRFPPEKRVHYRPCDFLSIYTWLFAIK
ncbi:hypothetical protein ACLOJK_013358 [Asimina triloba]